MGYKKRIVDDQLDLKLESFGATLIIGPKGCGKTTSAKQKSKSFVEFQGELCDGVCSVAYQCRDGRCACMGSCKIHIPAQAFD